MISIMNMIQTDSEVTNSEGQLQIVKVSSKNSSFNILDGQHMPPNGQDIQRISLHEPLSGKPFFTCILPPSSVHRIFKLEIPLRFHAYLPVNTVPAALIYRDKTWPVSCVMKGKRKVFDTSQWQSFVVDNRLRAGDGCVFELFSVGGANESLIFKVQILHG